MERKNPGSRYTSLWLSCIIIIRILIPIVIGIFIRKKIINKRTLGTSDLISFRNLNSFENIVFSLDNQKSSSLVAVEKLKTNHYESILETFQTFFFIFL